MLIDEVRQRPLIWQQDHPYYKNKQKRGDVFKEINEILLKAGHTTPCKRIFNFLLFEKNYFFNFVTQILAGFIDSQKCFYLLRRKYQRKLWKMKCLGPGFVEVWPHFESLTFLPYLESLDEAKLRRKRRTGDFIPENPFVFDK